MRKVLVTVLLILLCPFPVRALDPTKSVTQYVLDTWQTENGLPQANVLCIAQTRDGYLWIGTEEGLVRFDGARFVVFDRENAPGIQNNFINILLVDRSGTLWIGTGGGLTEYTDGIFTHHGKEQGLPDEHINTLRQDQDGNLWVGTMKGLACRRQGKFEAYNKTNGLPDNWISALAEDHSGGLWIGTPNGLGRWKDKHFSTVPLPGITTIYSLYSPRAEELWIGTHHDLKHYSQGNIVSFQVTTGPQNIPVRSIFRDRDGNLWLSTLGAGVKRFLGERFEDFTTSQGLPNDVVESLYEDREGSLWIGGSGGLSRLKNGKLTSYSVAEGLSYNLVWCVYQDREGQIWIGTDGGGLNCLRDGKFRVYTTRDGLSSNSISSIAEDRQGRLWVGTLGGGLNCFHNGKFVQYSSKDGLAGNWVWSIQPDHKGTLWVGTYNHGVSEWRDGVFKTHNSAMDGFPDSTHFIWEAPDGALFFATQGNGLIRWDHGKATSLTDLQKSGAKDLESIYADSDGTLWIGSISQGLVCFKEGKFTTITRKDGLPDDTVHAVLEDDNRNLWMSSNLGIFKVKKNALLNFVSGNAASVSVVSFGKSDGMKSVECNGGYQPGAWKSHDGKLWFPTIKGVVVIDPDRLEVNSVPPPVRIEEVIADNESISRFSSSAPVFFDPDKQKFEFHYTALSLLAPEKVRFRYKLEGFDSEWVDPGTRRVAYYTHLPPGVYRFKVRACNNDGVWNEADATFLFRLNPHFYQTLWFYGLCGMAVLFTGFAAHRLRLRQVRARFDAILAERNRLARELHDTLAQGMTGIISQLNAAEEVSDSSGRALAHVSRARDLARQNLDEARRAIRAMRPQLLERGNFLSAFSRTVSDLTANAPMQLDVQITGEDQALPAVVQDNVLRITQEAITNSMKYSQAKSLHIELNLRPRNVSLRVADDGIGFDPEKVPTDGHFGLIGMNERAKQLGGELIVRSSAGQGTEIFVSIPVA